MRKNIFVLGGCRSGKSSHAMEIAENISKNNKIYVATCIPYDDEMKDRVVKHQNDRDEKWRTVEIPVELPEGIEKIKRSYDVTLIDCITLSITNLMMKDMDENQIFEKLDDFIGAIKKSESSIVIVSNEVGTGIVPENSMARKFRDIAGYANQKIAAISDQVIVTMAGIPVEIKK